MYKVTYLEEYGPCPRVAIFPCYWDAKEWIDLITKKEADHLIKLCEEHDGPCTDKQKQDILNHELAQIKIEDLEND